jgi:hypothetical protein
MIHRMFVFPPRLYVQYTVHTSVVYRDSSKFLCMFISCEIALKTTSLQQRTRIMLPALRVLVYVHVIYVSVCLSGTHYCPILYILTFTHA